MIIRVFTDGACSGNPGAGGWAAIFNEKEKTVSFSGNEIDTTNNKMELLAVVKALKKIKSMNKNRTQFEIHSDSAYVINAINLKWVYKWKMNGWKTTRNAPVKNQSLWKELIRLMAEIEGSGRTITFVKVKGHAGNTFNEFADRLAREEAEKAKRLAN